MPKFGCHAVYEKDFETAIRAAAQAGFSYVQFDLNVPQFYIDVLSRHRLREIDTLATDLGVQLSFHAPGDSVGFFADMPAIRKGLLEHVKIVLEKANQLHAHHLTIHPLSPPSFRRADTLKDSFVEEHSHYYRAVLKENLEHAARCAGSVIIAVENLFFSKVVEQTLSEMLKRGTDVFLALDFAKMHSHELVMEPSQESFFSQHKDRIRELHLHDLNREGLSHLAPGQGGLDFKSLLGDYFNDSQWLTVEVRPMDQAAKARDMFDRILSEVTGT